MSMDGAALLNVLSLGVGIQSTTVFLKSCLGQLPKLDCAITADPGWERRKTYEYLRFLESVSEQYGIPIHRVSRGNIRTDALDSKRQGHRNGAHGRWGSLPYFVRNRDGSTGMVRRQCTSEYKIEPIEAFIKSQLLNIAPRKRWPSRHAVRVWQGISADEWQRIRYPTKTKKMVVGKDLFGNPIKENRTVPIRWKSNFYPLLGKELFSDQSHRDKLAPAMTRADCEAWLSQHGFPIPVRSACVGCPFHSDDEWAAIQRDATEEFEEACLFDEALRNADGIKGELFLHRSCVPLRQAILNGGDAENVSNQECFGMCGV